MFASKTSQNVLIKRIVHMLFETKLGRTQDVTNALERLKKY